MKVAFVDADDTLWRVSIRERKGRRKHKSKHIGIVSQCVPPFTKVDDDTLVDSTGTCTVELIPGVRDAIDSLRNNGYKTIVLSVNERKPVEEAVKAFGLSFDGVIADFYLDKPSVVEAVDKVCKPEDIIVVDDLAPSMQLPKNVKKFENIYELELER